MANQKISQLNSLDKSTIASNDVIPVVDVSSSETKKITYQELTQPTDANFAIADNVDTTKKVVFQVSGVTTGTTRTLTVPDASTSIVGTDTTQTLSNKTFTAPQINMNSDATGDMYYRDGSGVTSRLPIGSAGQIIQASVSGVPEWIANPSASDASTTVKGVVEIATSAEITAGTATGGTGATLVITPVQLASSAPTFDGSNITNVKPDVQQFTSSGTWTKPTGKTITIVKMYGAGGGGGGGKTGGGQQGGGGGGGGNYKEKIFRISDLPSTVSVTVGAGGTGGSAGVDGVDGSNTTFGALLTAYAGARGQAGGTGSSGGGGGGMAGIGGSGGLSFGGSPRASATNGIAGQGVDGGGTYQAEYGGSGGGNGGSVSTGAAGGSSMYGGGGGGGGGLNSTGGAGGTTGSYSQGGGAAANASGITVGQAGGGGSSNGTTGTAGGNGGIAAGGGGGGGGSSVGASGGNGGNGYCVVISV